MGFCVLLPGLAAAGETTMEGVAQVMTNQLGAFSRTQVRGAMEPATVYFRGKALRIEFHDRTGRPYAVVLPAAATGGWLQGGGGALPLPSARWPLQVDPQQPCAGQGLFAECSDLGAAELAGRQARKWRYRLSNATGPGMTRQGAMWVDIDTGFVLAYHSDTGAGPGKHWQVQTIRYAPQPEALFAAPIARKD